MFVARASWHICSRQPTGLSGGQDQSQRQIYIIEPLITVTRCSQLWSGENFFPKDVLLGKPLLNRRRLRVARVSQCEKVLSCSSFKTVFYWMNFKIFLFLFLELGIAVCPFTVEICASCIWKPCFFSVLFITIFYCDCGCNFPHLWWQFDVGKIQSLHSATFVIVRLSYSSLKGFTMVAEEMAQLNSLVCKCEDLPGDPWQPCNSQARG